jgi:hypothetical protein
LPLLVAVDAGHAVAALFQIGQRPLPRYRLDAQGQPGALAQLAQRLRVQPLRHALTVDIHERRIVGVDGKAQHLARLAQAAQQQQYGGGKTGGGHRGILG